MSIEEAILEKVRALPETKKTEVLEYVSRLEPATRMPFRSPKGILADLNFTLTEEDIADARREEDNHLKKHIFSGLGLESKTHSFSIKVWSDDFPRGTYGSRRRPTYSCG